MGNQPSHTMTRTETKVKTTTKNGKTVEETTTTTYHDDGRGETRVSTKTKSGGGNCSGAGRDDHRLDHHFDDFDRDNAQRALDRDIDRVRREQGHGGNHSCPSGGTCTET